MRLPEGGDGACVEGGGQQATPDSVKAFPNQVNHDYGGAAEKRRQPAAQNIKIEERCLLKEANEIGAGQQEIIDERGIVECWRLERVEVVHFERLVNEKALVNVILKRKTNRESVKTKCGASQ